MSGAVCLVGVLLFSATGITLNHAHQIPAIPVTESRTAVLPPDQLERLTGLATGESAPAELPGETVDWLDRHLGVRAGGIDAEWTDVDAYVALPRPGGDAWLSIDFESGEAVYEKTTRGVVAYLNDLHKGRNTGSAWAWFIDVFAAACVLFCLTGLWLLQMQARRHRSTWPLTAAGLALPIVLVVLFVH